MLITIHVRDGSFSDRWIDFCRLNSLPYVCVNAHQHSFHSEILNSTHFVYHWSHTSYADKLIALGLIRACLAKGILVFPNLNTCIDFDDKISQYFLLESLNIPHPRTYVSLSLDEILEDLRSFSYPIVFKLSNGAGSQNVRLVHSPVEVKKLEGAGEWTQSDAGIGP